MTVDSMRSDVCFVVFVQYGMPGLVCFVPFSLRESNVVVSALFFCLLPRRVVSALIVFAA